MAPCQNLEKSNDKIPRKRLARQKDKWKGESMDRSYFIGPLRLHQGSNNFPAASLYNIQFKMYKRM